MNITSVKPNPNKPETGFVKFDDGSEAWTPEIAHTALVVGKATPAGWTLREGPRGQQLLPPKEGGKGAPAAWRNTKEGALFEQDMMNRRTALMQAVQHEAQDVGGIGPVLSRAGLFYDWLTKVSGRAADGEDVAPPESTSAPRAAANRVREGDGEGAAQSPLVGADDSPTGTLPEDEGLVRQEATDPSSSGPVESPSNHLHGPWSEKRPDGAPMRDGWLRCEGCGQASLRKSVA